MTDLIDAAPRTFGTRARLRLLGRGAWVTILLTVVCLALALVALGTGKYALSIPEVISAAFDPDAGFERTVVLEWRLPRVVVALFFGAALGLAGALFQSLTRNSLGSPDIIGFTTGAYTGVLIATTVLGSGFAYTSLGALAGGMGTAVVVYLLAWRRGVQGFRLIVVGIAVTAMLHALNNWLLLRSGTEVAMSAALWNAGSISLVTWDTARPALLTLALGVPLVMALSGPLRQLELGDDTARSHGVPVEPSRLAIMLVGVALTAVVTAVAGPIAFVALTAPQIAHRLVAGSGLPLTQSALVGALTLLVADFAAQHLIPGSVAVGLVTIIVGGLYLLVLLVREARKSR